MGAVASAFDKSTVEVIEVRTGEPSAAATLPNQPAAGAVAPEANGGAAASAAAVLAFPPPSLHEPLGAAAQAAQGVERAGQRAGWRWRRETPEPCAPGHERRGRRVPKQRASAVSCR